MSLAYILRLFVRFAAPPAEGRAFAPVRGDIRAQGRNRPRLSGGTAARRAGTGRARLRWQPGAGPEKPCLSEGGSRPPADGAAGKGQRAGYGSRRSVMLTR